MKKSLILIVILILSFMKVQGQFEYTCMPNAFCYPQLSLLAKATV